MWDNTIITMLLEGTRDTLYMTIVSTFLRYMCWDFRWEFFLQ